MDQHMETVIQADTEGLFRFYPEKTRMGRTVSTGTGSIVENELF